MLLLLTVVTLPEKHSGNICINDEEVYIFCSSHVLNVFSDDELSSVENHVLVQRLNDVFVVATNDDNPRLVTLIILCGGTISWRFTKIIDYNPASQYLHGALTVLVR